MTAIEFLINELSKSKYFHRVLNEINDNSTIQKDVLKEALELEKQQIINAYLQKRRISNIFKSMKLCVDAEQYYNKTYKSE